VNEDEISNLPQNFQLKQNYPNPFNPSTTIPFHISCKSQDASRKSPIHTTLSIYNILGQKVRTLVDEEKLPGEYQVIWDGKDNSGKEVSSGIYFYQLKTGNYKETKRMLLVK
jgi:flagellar hook assembly protein FlgD